MSPPPRVDDPKAAAKELLLEDYKSLADTLWKNEQTGETRVNWYLGIVTAAVGGLIGLTGSEHRPHETSMRLIFLASLLSLLAFGLITLLRIIKRNATTDGYKEDSKAIRHLFREHFNDGQILRGYNPFGGTDDKGLARKLGGLAHTVLTINSLLVGGVAVAVVLPLPVPRTFEGGLLTRNLLTTCVAGVVAFGLAAVVQFLWVQSADKKVKKNLRTKPTHAGGIVFRLLDGDTVEYLLIQPKKEQRDDEWVLPKGHIEPEEEHWRTAMREVQEETGAFAQLVCAVDTDRYKICFKNIVAKFYLLEFVALGTTKEKRNPTWFEYEQALELLTHPGSKDILGKAEKKRREIAKAPEAKPNDN